MVEPNIEEIIKRGESQSLEFKRSLSLTREALESLCAMVNTDFGRGTVIFGVSPGGEIEGVEPGSLDKAQRSLSQSIGDKFEPALIAQIGVVDLSGRRLVVVHAQRSKLVPYHEFDGRAHIREGTVTRQLSLVEKRALTKARDRDQHSGPWRCDRCGTIAGTISSIDVTDQGVRKSYSCSCGGQYWPEQPGT